MGITHTQPSTSPPIGASGWDAAHTVDSVAPSGLTGATTATRYVGGTASVAPTTGTFSTGDFVVTQAGSIYICTAGGSPGTWVAAGVGWTLSANESGTSFANFTSGNGTWSSNGTEIIQTDTSATQRRAKYNTLVPIGFPMVFQCEAQVASIGSGGFYRAGINISDNANPNGLIAYIDSGAGAVSADLDSVSGINSVSTTISTATWYTLRLVTSGYMLSVYLDGTLKFNGMSPALRVTAQYVGLTSYAASVKFRNFKVWTLSTGAP